MKNQFHPKYQRNYFWFSALKFFVASCWLFEDFWASPGDLVSNNINKEAYRRPQKAFRKPQGSYKQFQGRNPEIISLVFWMKLIFHKDILRLTDLYCCHSCSLSCYCCGCLQAREQEQGGLPTTMEDRSTARVQQGIAVQCGLFFNKVVNKRAIAHCNIL